MSYRRADCAYVADSIYHYLKVQYPRTYLFRDVEGILPGTTFPQKIDEALASCNVMLVLIGREWAEAKSEKGLTRLFLENDFVRMEIESGIQRGIPIIPVLLEHANLPDTDQLPDSLKPLTNYHFVRLNPEPDFPTDLKRLRDAIAAHLPDSKPTFTDFVKYSLLLFPMQNSYAQKAKFLFYFTFGFAMLGALTIVFPEWITDASMTEEMRSRTRFDGASVFVVFGLITSMVYFFAIRLNDK